MTEVTNQVADQDPMSAAASGLEAPRFPVLAADRVCRFRISSAKVSATKETAERAESEQEMQLVLILKTEKDYTDSEGKPLRKGFPVYHYTGITPLPERQSRKGTMLAERTFKDIAAELGVILRAAYGPNTTHTPREVVNNPSMLENQIVDCKVGIRKGEGTYNDSNTVKFVQPA